MNEYTKNQPIESTQSNEPIFGTGATLCNGTCKPNSPPQISTCPLHTYFSTGANPPSYQGSKWQTEIHDADKYNTSLITNEPNKCEHQFVFSHKSAETVGVQAIYQTVIYVICPKCGLVKWQV